MGFLDKFLNNNNIDINQEKEHPQSKDPIEAKDFSGRDGIKKIDSDLFSEDIKEDSGIDFNKSEEWNNPTDPVDFTEQFDDMELYDLRKPLQGKDEEFKPSGTPNLSAEEIKAEVDAIKTNITPEEQEQFNKKTYGDVDGLTKSSINRGENFASRKYKKDQVHFSSDSRWYRSTNAKNSKRKGQYREWNNDNQDSDRVA